MKKHIPWVEKYRPTNLENVVLDSTNKTILNNIIKNNYFPNLLFYGPPGTGKTTTVINLIDKMSYITSYKSEKNCPSFIRIYLILNVDGVVIKLFKCK